MTPNDVRNRFAEVAAATSNENAVEAAVALERISNAMEVVIGDLENPSSADYDTVMLSQQTMCRQLGAALGLRGGGAA